MVIHENPLNAACKARKSNPLFVLRSPRSSEMEDKDPVMAGGECSKSSINKATEALSDFVQKGLMGMLISSN